MRARGLMLRALAASSLLVVCDCAQKPVSVPVRSLERSGKLALLCLDPESNDNPGRPLETCESERVRPNPNVPNHVYALVTQTTRGEVAVLDVSAGAVLDLDSSAPGYNFLPVGAQPVDIVASRGSSAAFVGSAEANHPGIYALPATRVRGGAPSLRTWPACALPARPGVMMVVSRPSTAEAACEAPNWAEETLTPDETPGEAGDVSREGFGAQKLLVALPTEGDVLVIDAQKILDRRAGTFDPCPIERRYKLRIDLPPTHELSSELDAEACPPIPGAGPVPAACPVREPRSVSYSRDFSPSPADFALDGNRLFVADEEAPVVHVLDVGDPCAITELPPLLPTSYDDPGRPVYTSSVAVSPILSDGEQFVYAVDQRQGTIMAFDVKDGATSRAPIHRGRPDFFPFSPRDRIALGSPVQDVSFFTTDLPFDPGTGALEYGVKCDPYAARDTREGVYQTREDFSAGAAPRMLRGTFAVAALTSGALMYIDVDDYDQACRVYEPPPSPELALPSWVTGCEACVPFLKSTGGTVELPATGGSGEGTCRAVVRHELRSAFYISSNDQTGPHYPAFQNFPILREAGNTLRTDLSEEGRLHPKLLGPTADGELEWFFGRGTSDIRASADAAQAERNFVVADVREPRTAVDQEWSLTYEGAIPGFEGKVAKLNVSAADPAARGFFDGGASFCGRGVQDLDAARVVGRRVLRRPGEENAEPTEPEVEAFARAHADLVEITSDLLYEEDPYWSTTGDACSFVRCRAVFGTAASPTVNRSFPIVQAYQDRVLVDADPDGVVDVTDPERARRIQPECCFPSLIQYGVRASQTWVALGGATSFSHHTIVGPEGRCVEAGVDPATGEVCEPSFQLRTGRAFEEPARVRDGQPSFAAPLPFDHPKTFHNAHFYFVVYGGQQPSRRGMNFTWRMAGGFAPLHVALGRGSVQVSPQSLFMHPAIGPSALVADGAMQGVLLVDLARGAVAQTFF